MQEGQAGDQANLQMIQQKAWTGFRVAWGQTAGSQAAPKAYLMAQVSVLSTQSVNLAVRVLERLLFVAPAVLHERSGEFAPAFHPLLVGSHKEKFLLLDAD